MTIFLEHKNSEPAMKILMRNVGMTLHVIHTLRRQGIDNVQVNMDWQHLIMNGENLAEYAALLAADGLLGHQHANSGWGTFDDDNMVGATAFMETLELALELRRAGYGENGERLGFDLYPYTEDAVAAVRRSVLQWRFIDSVAAKIDGAALREAQQAKDAVARLRARVRRSRRLSRREASARLDRDPARRGRTRRERSTASVLGLEERDVLPKLDPARFIWFRVGGDLELHLMLGDEPPSERAALLPRRGRSRRAACAG